jgi:hypothetical protein
LLLLLWLVDALLHCRLIVSLSWYGKLYNISWDSLWDPYVSLRNILNTYLSSTSDLVCRSNLHSWSSHLTIKRWSIQDLSWWNHLEFALKMIICIWRHLTLNIICQCSDVHSRRLISLRCVNWSEINKLRCLTRITCTIN